MTYSIKLQFLLKNEFITKSIYLKRYFLFNIIKPKKKGMKGLGLL